MVLMRQTQKYSALESQMMKKRCHGQKGRRWRMQGSHHSWCLGKQCLREEGCYKYRSSLTLLGQILSIKGDLLGQDLSGSK